jgi:magnesium transporter
MDLYIAEPPSSLGESPRGGVVVVQEAFGVTAHIRSIADHTGFLSQKITFLLDATLGLINIEQNNIIKIFSIAAVIFLPPTLVASYFGMNFKFMGEFDLPWGEFLAVGLMVVSVLAPLAWFRRKNWL